jgi:hypothetical protein
MEFTVIVYEHNGGSFLFPDFRLVKMSLLLKNRFHFAKLLSEALTDNIK